MRGDWREGDLPLDIHKFDSFNCLFLQTPTSESNSSPPVKQALPQSFTHSQSTDGSSTGQFSYRSNQVTRTRVRPIMQPSGSLEN